MAQNEGLVLDGLDLNDGTSYELEAFDPGIAPARPEWISGADAAGAELVRDVLHDNATGSMRVRVLNTSSTAMDAALAAVGAVVDRLAEASKSPDGVELEWTPAQSTKTGTGYLLHGAIKNLPITVDGDLAGWFVARPILEIEFTRMPYWYGAEVTETPVTAATPAVTVEVADVAGDVPAEGRLIVTDDAAQARSYVAWGLEHRHYDAGTSLLIDSDSLVTSGFAGSQTTRTGAYDPGSSGNSIISAEVGPSPIAVCGTGNLSHVGTFRVIARAYPVSTQVHVRLAWREGAGQYRANRWQSPPTYNQFVELDLGLITIPEKTLGTQRWDARIEAYTDDVSDTIQIDYLVLVPAGEGYGKAFANPEPVIPGAASASDRFGQSAGALHGKTADVGGTWATSGSATGDFTVSGSGVVTRTNTTDTGAGRFALLGSATPTDVFARVDMKATVPYGSRGLVLRYVDSSNFALIATAWSGTLGTLGTTTLYLYAITGGSTVVSTTVEVAHPGTEYMTIAGMIDSLGRVRAWFGPAAAPLGAPDAEMVAPVLATGGTLASGKSGLWDNYNVGDASTRTFDNLFVGVPEIDYAIAAGRSLEVRHDLTIREDSTGTYWGPVSKYRGSRFLLPCAGSDDRTSRLAVLARRDDIETGTANAVTDSTTVQVAYRPRYLAVPR